MAKTQTQTQTQAVAADPMAMLQVMMAEMAKLKEQLAQAQTAAKAAKPEAKVVTFAVTEKGAFQVKGGKLRRFGVTLYATEWETLFAHMDALKGEFAKAEKAGKLSRKAVAE